MKYTLFIVIVIIFIIFSLMHTHTLSLHRCIDFDSTLECILTKYNISDDLLRSEGESVFGRPITHLNQIKPYANVQGEVCKRVFVIGEIMKKEDEKCEN